eukprot:COSAG06_NODE_6841_length_2751_cov_5.815611_2_plen_75_part_00
MGNNEERLRSTTTTAATRPWPWPRTWHSRKPWDKCFSKENQISVEALDFLENLLRCDHQEWMMAKDAQSHVRLL